MTYITIVIIGIIFGFIIFWKNPVLLDDDEYTILSPPKISVIIPARNEEKNLAYLLEDLNNQKTPAYETICVDDQSEDRTADIVKSFGVNLISVGEKPVDWTGKSWACQLGATSSSGELMLFLDADVRLAPTAISKLIAAYNRNKCAVSVQPYHDVKKHYEQLSLFFNLVGIGANGICLPFQYKSVGLFGPVILLSREDYNTIDGHYSARKSVTDDLALGEALTRKNIDYKLLLGGDSITFRMYRGGVKQLIEGWSKNFVTGAIKTSPYLLLMLILWVGAYISVAGSLLASAFRFNTSEIAVYSLLYIVLALQLLNISRRIGSFKKSSSILYPIPLISFLAIFIASVFKKIFLGSAKWKGRDINLRR